MKNFKLTPEQQKLVEANLNLIDILLHTKITPNEQIRGMEYDELYQCGCIALCRAAATYDGSTLFRTYASHVAVHALIDQCRSAQRHSSHAISYDVSVSEEDDDDSHAIFLKEEACADDLLAADELMQILRHARTSHHGAVLRGIEAIELQIKGYSGAEIARMYGVKNNHVTSWISKARAVLRAEHPEYLT